jgi:hypothetical protein
LKKVLNITNRSENDSEEEAEKNAFQILNCLKEEIEQQITKLSKETNEVLLIEESFKQSHPNQKDEEEVIQEAETYLADDVDRSSKGEGPPSLQGNHPSNEEVPIITTQDIKEAESEVSEEVYSIYV